METNKPSRTARVTAAHRAYESQKPSDERICYDPYAQAFIGSNWNPLGEFALPRRAAFWLWELFLPGWNAYFAARTRFIDDALQVSLDRGLEQLVVMGAGYDSRALRYDQLKHSVKVFEIDHPATQQIKSAKLKEMFGAVPGHIRLVPIDFTKDSLRNRLHESGYESQRRTMFIWEGVCMYLTPTAVDETLAFVASCSGPGSSIVFDYTYPSVVNGTCPRREATIWRNSVKRVGEGLLFGIEEGTIKVFLEQRGFSVATNANHDSLKQRYFTGINQKRAITPVIEIVHASVV